METGFKMNERLPALSLHQPWAWAIFNGKSVENRNWATRYRGRIRIHAAKTWDAEGEAWMRENGVAVPEDFRKSSPEQMGAYIGEVTVEDCCEFSPCMGHDHDFWPFGPICWILSDPIAYPEPIPGRGYPGLYLPERFEKKRREQ